MAFNPEIRASDTDRDRVAAALREHCAQGRIGVDELNERLDLAYRARTLGDLQKVTSDLPEEDMYELPVPASRSSMPARRPSGEVYRKGMRAGWASYASVNLVCIVIWLLSAVSSGSWYPWWIWVAGPWGALLLAGQLFGSHDERR
ncbi:DUF1707 domain-containing protein [Actinoallomurus vinaceus]|uniref:DUF1707 domain-containing protein n=1 Tax=Actinoallomurus vinaceus TaxID=1080074 RepID=A0ABP8U341_9ACTN